MSYIENQPKLSDACEEKGVENFVSHFRFKLLHSAVYCHYH